MLNVTFNFSIIIMRWGNADLNYPSLLENASTVFYYSLPIKSALRINICRSSLTESVCDTNPPLTLSCETAYVIFNETGNLNSIFPFRGLENKRLSISGGLGSWGKRNGDTGHARLHASAAGTSSEVQSIGSAGLGFGLFSPSVITSTHFFELRDFRWNSEPRWSWKESK